MTTSIFRVFTFEAAHRLPAVPPNHKCAQTHGHSYEVRVEAQGVPNPALGWFEDWGQLDYAWAHVHGSLDHHFLNEVPGLENPTCENLAEWLWQKLAPLIKGLSKITIHESPRGGVVYTGPDA